MSDEPVIQCRVRIEGTYKGKPWTYEDAEGEEGSQYLRKDSDGNLDPSTFWWSEGNFSCDCNRGMFLPDEMQADLPCRDDEEGFRCGDQIRIQRIVPFDNRFPTLELDETHDG